MGSKEKGSGDMIASLEALRQKRAPVRLPPPGERKRIRNEYGVSQGDVAAVLGVSRLTVSMWERGETDPKPDHAQKYAELLDQMQQEIKDKATEGNGNDQ